MSEIINVPDTISNEATMNKDLQDTITSEKNIAPVDEEVAGENAGQHFDRITSSQKEANEETAAVYVSDDKLEIKVPAADIAAIEEETDAVIPKPLKELAEKKLNQKASAVTAPIKGNEVCNKSINTSLDNKNEEEEKTAIPSSLIEYNDSPKEAKSELETQLSDILGGGQKTMNDEIEQMDIDSNNVKKTLDMSDMPGGHDTEPIDDSQESLPLVIDEKLNSPEQPTLSETHENDTDFEEPGKSPKNANLLNDEAAAGIRDKEDVGSSEKDNEKDKCIDNAGCETVQENVIEIDDDIEETKVYDPDVEITETRSSTYIPVIEIDDDDDDEIPPQKELTNKKKKLSAEQPLPASVAETSVLEENNVSEEKPKEPQADLFKQKPTETVDQKTVIITQQEVEKSNEDVEMKDITKMDTIEKAPVLLKSSETQNEAKKSALDAEESSFDETIEEVFYNKECINHDCPHNHKQFFQAPQFALSHFQIKKRRSKNQYVCAECYDNALEIYEEYCSLLKAKQPLLLKKIAVQGPEFVEITDSSEDEEEEAAANKFQITKGSFSKTELDLIEAELENSIKNVIENLDIQNQLTWTKTILSTRLRQLEGESNLNDELLRSLQKRADQLYSSLYQCPKIRLRQFQPLDLNTGLPYSFPEVAACPPVGEISRTPIEINQIYYAVKNKAIASWVPCKVIESVEPSIILGPHAKVPHYKVKFLKLQYQMVKTVSAKHLAYYDPPKVRLPIGSRVIAYFDASSLSRGKEKMMIQSAFYPGIIAEPLKPNNKYRYLIFYDDGYTQYVSHKDVRLVCNVTEQVWEDVHPASREFIQKYLTQYSINRPMVQTQKGQSMTTESNGKWIYARVIDIDCSLIQMQFEGPKSHTEWIYRGSLRLGPVFKEYQKTLQKDSLPLPRLARRTEPFIRYTADEEATTVQQQQQHQQHQQHQHQTQHSQAQVRTSPNEPRAVAKKSVSRLSTDSTTSTAPSPTPSVPTVRHLNNSTIYLEDENKPKGKVVYYTAKRDLPPLTYRPHKCSPTCLFKIPHNLSAYSPLSKPLLSGWERPIMRLKSKKIVAYRGPCGKIMRNMEEVRRYLRATNNILNVDNFDFHHETSCLAEYVIESAIVQKRDISGGQEKMAIPLVNYYDSTLPPECKYAAQRIPTDGVNLNLNPDFLVGCDCEGDCSDKQKCSCWQLTYAGAKYGNPNIPVEEIGYQYKRLYEHVPTGIYECNSRCKCKSNCLNRVAQQPLAMKLQVFKTSNRGWGLRCINDVPRGSFVCIYAGHLLTEAKANEGGLDAGDEYFAELDYIEVAEQIKEGYESDVEPPEADEEEESYAPDPEEDEEFTPSKSVLTRAKNRAQKLTRSTSSQNTDEDSQERQVINFNPNADMNEDSARESSIRTLFGKDEACYVMDAKITGNLGRYFNHSCSPNLFVQNVFVDTHDLRFPWVAFFSSTNIRAGTELTWNYNYEVGVVPGKVLYCQCGAPNCRLRLL